MFDLRYHVASLAAVFLALIIGILVGVGISDRGLVDKASRSLLEQRIRELQGNLRDERDRSAELTREQEATQRYVAATYPALMANRLRRQKIALVFVGPVDSKVRADVEQTLADADSPGWVRLRALKVPLDVRAIDRRLARTRDFRRFVGNRQLGSLGIALGEELASGGDARLWRVLADQIVVERAGGGEEPADGVVIVRSAPKQGGSTARFLRGFYDGVTIGRGPAVGVEVSDAATSAVDVYRAVGISTVDDIDKPIGRLALALLLDGAKYGHYGLKPSATDVLPPIRRRARRVG
jgi:Copper transport outer membrane protein, MctB